MWKCLRRPVSAWTPLEPLRWYLFNAAAAWTCHVAAELQRCSRQQDARSGRWTCWGAVIQTARFCRNQRKTRGKTRQGEGLCRKRSTNTKKKKKKRRSWRFFESSECCQNRGWSNSCFVNSHCRAECLSVQHQSERCCYLNAAQTVCVAFNVSTMKRKPWVFFFSFSASWSGARRVLWFHSSAWWEELMFRLMSMYNWDDLDSTVTGLKNLQLRLCFFILLLIISWLLVWFTLHWLISEPDLRWWYG